MPSQAQKQYRCVCATQGIIATTDAEQEIELLRPNIQVTFADSIPTLTYKLNNALEFSFELHEGQELGSVECLVRKDQDRLAQRYKAIIDRGSLTGSCPASFEAEGAQRIQLRACDTAGYCSESKEQAITYREREISARAGEKTKLPLAFRDTNYAFDFSLEVPSLPTARGVLDEVRCGLYQGENNVSDTARMNLDRASEGLLSGECEFFAEGFVEGKAQLLLDICFEGEKCHRKNFPVQKDTSPPIVHLSGSNIIRRTGNIILNVTDNTGVKRVSVGNAAGEIFAKIQGDRYQRELDYSQESSGQHPLIVYVEDMLGNSKIYDLGLIVINKGPRVAMDPVSPAHNPNTEAGFSINPHLGQEIDYDSIKCLEGGRAFPPENLDQMREQSSLRGNCALSFAEPGTKTIQVRVCDTGDYCNDSAEQEIEFLQPDIQVTFTGSIPTPTYKLNNALEFSLELHEEQELESVECLVRKDQDLSTQRHKAIIDRGSLTGSCVASFEAEGAQRIKLRVCDTAGYCSESKEQAITYREREIGAKAGEGTALPLAFRDTNYAFSFRLDAPSLATTPGVLDEVRCGLYQGENKVSDTAKMNLAQANEGLLTGKCEFFAEGFVEGKAQLLLDICFEGEKCHRKNFPVQKDVSPPIVQLTGPKVIRGVDNITLAVTDATAINKVSVGDAAGESFAKIQGNLYQLEFNSTSKGSGPYDLIVYAEDSLGNHKNYPLKLRLINDAPVVSWAQTPSNLSYAPTYNLEFQLAPYPGQEIEYRSIECLDSEDLERVPEYHKPVIARGSFAGSCALSFAEPGTKRVRVKVCDKQGLCTLSSEHQLSFAKRHINIAPESSLMFSDAAYDFAFRLAVPSLAHTPGIIDNATCHFSQSGQTEKHSQELAFVGNILPFAADSAGLCGFYAGDYADGKINLNLSVCFRNESCTSRTFSLLKNTEAPSVKMISSNIITGTQLIVLEVVDDTGIRKVSLNNAAGRAFSQNSQQPGRYELLFDSRSFGTTAYQLNVYAEDNLSNSKTYQFDLTFVNSPPVIRQQNAVKTHLTPYEFEFSIHPHPGQEIDESSIRCGSYIFSGKSHPVRIISRNPWRAVCVLSFDRTDNRYLRIKACDTSGQCAQGANRLVNFVTRVTASRLESEDTFAEDKYRAEFRLTIPSFWDEPTGIKAAGATCEMHQGNVIIPGTFVGTYKKLSQGMYLGACDFFTGGLSDGSVSLILQICYEKGLCQSAYPLPLAKDATPPTVRLDGRNTIRRRGKLEFDVSDQTGVRLVALDDSRGRSAQKNHDNLYEFYLNTHHEPSGPRTIKIYAEDSLGNNKTYPININLINHGPAVTLAQPSSSYRDSHELEFTLSPYPGQEIDYGSIECLDSEQPWRLPAYHKPTINRGALQGTCTVSPDWSGLENVAVKVCDTHNFCSTSNEVPVSFGQREISINNTSSLILTSPQYRFSFLLGVPSLAEEQGTIDTVTCYFWQGENLATDNLAAIERNQVTTGRGAGHCDFNAAEYSEGQVSMRVEVCFRDENCSQQAFTLKKDTRPPQVSLTSGLVMRGMHNIRIRAYDISGTRQVRLGNAAGAEFIETSAGGHYDADYFQLEFDSGTLDSGTHRLGVYAEDELGHNKTYYFNFDVINDGPVPIVGDNVTSYKSHYDFEFEVLLYPSQPVPLSRGLILCEGAARSDTWRIVAELISTDPLRAKCRFNYQPAHPTRQFTVRACDNLLTCTSSEVRSISFTKRELRVTPRSSLAFNAPSYRLDFELEVPSLTEVPGIVDDVRCKFSQGNFYDLDLAILNKTRKAEGIFGGACDFYAGDYSNGELQMELEVCFHDELCSQETIQLFKDNSPPDIRCGFEDFYGGGSDVAECDVQDAFSNLAEIRYQVLPAPGSSPGLFVNRSLSPQPLPRHNFQVPIRGQKAREGGRYLAHVFARDALNNSDTASYEFVVSSLPPQLIHPELVNTRKDRIDIRGNYESIAPLDRVTCRSSGVTPVDATINHKDKSFVCPNFPVDKRTWQREVQLDARDRSGNPALSDLTINFDNRAPSGEALPSHQQHSMRERNEEEDDSRIGIIPELFTISQAKTRLSLFDFNQLGEETLKRNSYHYIGWRGADDRSRPGVPTQNDIPYHTQAKDLNISYSYSQWNCGNRDIQEDRLASCVRWEGDYYFRDRPLQQKLAKVIQHGPDEAEVFVPLVDSYLSAEGKPFWYRVGPTTIHRLDLKVCDELQNCRQYVTRLRVRVDSVQPVITETSLPPITLLHLRDRNSYRSIIRPDIVTGVFEIHNPAPRPVYFRAAPTQNATQVEITSRHYKRVNARRGNYRPLDPSRDIWEWWIERYRSDRGCDTTDHPRRLEIMFDDSLVIPQLFIGTWPDAVPIPGYCYYSDSLLVFEREPGYPRNVDTAFRGDEHIISEVVGMQDFSVTYQTEQTADANGYYRLDPGAKMKVTVTESLPDRSRYFNLNRPPRILAGYGSKQRYDYKATAKLRPHLEILHTLEQFGANTGHGSVHAYHYVSIREQAITTLEPFWDIPHYLP